MSEKQIGGIILIALGLGMIFDIDLFRFLIPIGLIGLGINMLLKSMK